MPRNELINEFSHSNEDQLAQRITDLFDTRLDETDESVAILLREELERILQERIDALDQN
jgi:phenylpyruvate tautomerase PptA (4-oxalocrotonate tautomerase family)